MTDKSSAPELDRLVERIAALHERARSSLSDRPIELYHRASSAIRMSREGAGEQDSHHAGTEEGLAIRWRAAGGGFASCSGSGIESLSWLVAQVGGHGGSGNSAPYVWQLGPGLRIDRDGNAELPSHQELAGWLALSWREVERAPTARGLVPAEAWVEAATTVETWVTDGGFRASRRRARCWAMVRLSPRDGSVRAPKPVLIARRRFGRLPVGGWRDLLEDRWLAEAGAAPAPTAPTTVLFNPECSAILVLALVKALHTHLRKEDLAVGKGWRVTDDPTDPDALFGGSFDDAGFETHRTVLADGEREVGSIGEQGHFRRPSFRDPPIPLPAHLVQSAEGCDPPSDGLIVSGLVLHPLSPDLWQMELDAALMRAGRPGSRLQGATIRISPGDLVRRCVGSVGPARLSHLGVRTPALVFEDLRVQGDRSRSASSSRE